MAVTSGPKISRDNLVFQLDAKNPKMLSNNTVVSLSDGNKATGSTTISSSQITRSNVNSNIAGFSSNTASVYLVHQGPSSNTTQAVFNIIDGDTNKFVAPCSPDTHNTFTVNATVLVNSSTIYSALPGAPDAHTAYTNNATVTFNSSNLISAITGADIGPHLLFTTSATSTTYSNTVFSTLQSTVDDHGVLTTVGGNIVRWSTNYPAEFSLYRSLNTWYLRNKNLSHDLTHIYYGNDTSVVITYNLNDGGVKIANLNTTLYSMPGSTSNPHDVGSFEIGVMNSRDSLHYDGSLYSIIVYDKELSSSDISLLNNLKGI